MSSCCNTNSKTVDGVSTKFREYSNEKRKIEELRSTVLKSLQSIENDLETLRKEYSVACDHPTRVSHFPVCGVCERYAPHEK